MKPEPCNLALKLLDADEACGACGHAARTHRNHASYVGPEIVAGILRVTESNTPTTPHVPVELPPVSKPEASTRAGELALRVEASKSKPADEFAGWSAAMLRTAIAFERATVAELRLDLHREREQRQALERGVVEIRHAACAALTWATDSKPDVANTRRAVDEVVRRLRDELAATKNDEAYNATLIRERDEWKTRADKLANLRDDLISQRGIATKELREIADVIAAALSVPIDSKPGSASLMVRKLIDELAGLRAERERGYRAKTSIEVVGVVADRGTESAVLALAWARESKRTKEEIESQIEKLDALAIVEWSRGDCGARGFSAHPEATRRAIAEFPELLLDPVVADAANVRHRR